MPKIKMKEYRFLRSTHIVFILLTISMLMAPSRLSGESGVIPGDIDKICSYTGCFYNFPPADFFYYLNDQLLFTEKPDGKIMGGGIRNKLLKILRWHQMIKKSLKRFKRDKDNMIVINTAEPEGYRQSAIISNMLGLRMGKTPEGRFSITENPSAAIPDYFRFTGTTPDLLARQLNKTGYFYFKLREEELPVPWDFAFLNEITGLNIDKTSFLETLLKDEQFSLLLGTLYRLSGREVDRIAGIVTDPPSPAGGWKRIYTDKKFLMGMFLLSDALRADENGDWIFPGGAEAEAFWDRITGTIHKTSPLEFLYNLAVKDDGKLNYLFIFASFLPPETQHTLFTGEGARRMEAIYEGISLTEKEKLQDSKFPGLKNSNFYTLLYSLTADMPGGRVSFPLNARKWLDVLDSTTSPEAVEVSPVTKEVGAMLKGSEEIKGPLDKKAARRNKKKSGFYLKLGGTAGFFDAGDFSDLIDNNKRSSNDLVRTIESPFFRGIGGEFGYRFGRLSVGIESGTISRRLNARLDDAVFYGKWDRTFSAVPLFLNLYLTMLDTSFADVYLTGGSGVYFGKYKETWISNYISRPGTTQKGLEIGTANSIGFNAGGGIELRIAKGVHFFVQGRYCFVRFKEMDAWGKIIDNYEYPTSYFDYRGELYYLPRGEGGKADFVIGPGSGGDKAVFSLNGLSLSAGFQFTFF
jgi:hypothetical protein